MRELVSILIPAYNAEQWIGETIRSALAQSWSNCEIIIVDDGSSDNTFNIAKSYQSRSLKVVTQENMGASSARNRALSLAQGDYIQWLDADDLLAPEKISCQLKTEGFGKDSLILLSSSFGRFSYRRHKARFIPTSLWQDLEPAEWLIIRFINDVWMYPAVWLLSRKLAEVIGPWDERLSLNDDGEYFGRAVSVCESVKFVPGAKSYYRQANNESLSKIVTHKGCESLFISIRLCIEYLLSLENSERSRAASLTYLQNKLIYFYPEEHEILREISNLAQELGGKISPPELRNKYLLVKKLFGWPTAKNLVLTVPRFKKKLFGSYDRLMFQLGNDPNPLVDGSFQGDFKHR